ncbi:hypothetical protein Tco_0260966 [Tanacetum coccineum]
MKEGDDPASFFASIAHLRNEGGDYPASFLPPIAHLPDEGRDDPASFLPHWLVFEVVNVVVVVRIRVCVLGRIRYYLLLWIKAQQYTIYDSPEEAKNHLPPSTVWGERTHDEWNELVDWFSHPNQVSRSMKNAANRAKNTIPTHQGKKSFAQGRNEYSEKGHHEDLSSDEEEDAHQTERLGQIKIRNENESENTPCKIRLEPASSRTRPIKKSWMKSFRVTTVRTCQAWAVSYRVVAQLLRSAQIRAFRHMLYSGADDSDGLRQKDQEIELLRKQVRRRNNGLIWLR